MTRKIGLTYTWTFTVHDAAGALSNADALPVAAVYEDDTDVSVDTPTVEQIGVLTGHYRVIAYLDPLIYTADHSYNVMVTMAVGGVSMGARVESFVAETANQTDILATLNSLITAVGVPVALDGGDATLAGMLTKMADDNGGADFDATTDSLHESAGGGGGGPTKEEIRIEMDANSTRLAAIDQNTSDTVALVLAT